MGAIPDPDAWSELDLKALRKGDRVVFCVEIAEPLGDNTFVRTLGGAIHLSDCLEGHVLPAGMPIEAGDRVEARLAALEAVAHPPIDLGEVIAAANVSEHLKRIADALSSCNEYGEAGSEAIYGAISRALRERR